MAGAQRYEVLDGLRGVAALSVLLYHITQYTAAPILRGSYLAVDIFFCLSGFVIAHSYSERLENGMSIKTFLTLRFIRLYPMFLIGLILGATAILVMISSGGSNLTVRRLLDSIALNSLYIPYIGSFYIQHGSHMVSSPTFPSDDPGWSLSFEILVNIAFAFSCTRFRRIPVWLIVLISAGALFAYVMITHNATPGWGASNLLGGVPRVFFGFYLGVLIFKMVSTGIVPAVRFHYALIIAGVVACFIVEREGKLWLWLTLLAVLPTVYFGSLSELKSNYARSILKYLGWLSYPLYCVHMPIYLLATSFLGASLRTSVFAGVGSLATAHVLCRFAEEPIRTALLRRFSVSTRARHALAGRDL